MTALIIEFSPAPCAQLAERECSDFLSDQRAFNVALAEYSSRPEWGRTQTGCTHHLGRVISINPEFQRGDGQ